MPVHRHVFPAGLAAIIAIAAVAPLSASAAVNPVVGTRTITTAAGGAIPECLTSDDKGQVRLATLCFREGADHSWTIAPGPSGGYVLKRGTRCLTFDPVRVPHLRAMPCAPDRVGQTWQIAPRPGGHHQIGQGWVCITARAGEVGTDACNRSDDGWGSDNSGQAWKILKDPQSVVPDPSFGGGPKPYMR